MILSNRVFAPFLWYTFEGVLFSLSLVVRIREEREKKTSPSYSLYKKVHANDDIAFYHRFSMANRPLVTVVGATGAQGGAVVKSLVETGKYQVNCFQR